MREAAIVMTIIAFGVAGAMQMLPGDGATVTVYGLDAEIADGADDLFDLTGADVTGETEMRFEHYGESLVRRVAGLQADWLRVSGDTRRENNRYFLAICSRRFTPNEKRVSVSAALAGRLVISLWQIARSQCSHRSNASPIP